MPLTAKKSLGQHFLTSEHVLHEIIDAASIRSGENILEIGPGTGFLTDSLLKSGANIVAVEKDERAYRELLARFSTDPQWQRKPLRLICGDILTLPVNTMFPESEFSRPIRYALIANIPYYITGAILERFIGNDPRPDRAVLLVQKDVADRIIAENGKESILSISIKAFGTPKIVSRVPAGAFSPPPSVVSAVLSIQNISDKLFREKGITVKHFFTIIKAAFAHKRKFAVRNIEAEIERNKIESAWHVLGLKSDIRAEDIPLPTWFEIAKLCE